jgi:hypothetical protein
LRDGRRGEARISCARRAVRDSDQDRRWDRRGR